MNARYARAMREHHPEARKEYCDRLSHVNLRWRIACQEYRARTSPTERVRVRILEEGPDWKKLRVDLPPAVQLQTDFIQRVAKDPHFWAAIYRQTSEPKFRASGTHRRGRAFARRRETYTHLWLQLLATGTIEYRDLERWERDPGYGGLGARGVSELLRSRDKAGTPYTRILALEPAATLSDGSGPDARLRARPSWVLGGELAPRELELFFRREFDDLDEGEPAASFESDSPLLGRERRWWAVEEFTESFVTFRESCLRAMKRIRADSPLERAIREALTADVRHCWWPLKKLHQYVSAEVALDWFNARGRPAQRECLRRTSRPRARRGHFDRVASLLVASRHREPPVVTPDAAAMLLMSATRAGWLREGIPRSELVRFRLACEGALRLRGLSDRACAIVTYNRALALARLGNPAAARRALRRAHEAGELVPGLPEELRKLGTHLKARSRPQEMRFLGEHQAGSRVRWSLLGI